MTTRTRTRTTSTHPQHDDQGCPVTGAPPAEGYDDDALEADGRPTFSLVRNG